MQRVQNPKTVLIYSIFGTKVQLTWSYLLLALAEPERYLVSGHRLPIFGKRRVKDSARKVTGRTLRGDVFVF